MKCKNCGANYATKELSCPYCEADNFLGRRWKRQTNEALYELAETKDEVKQYIVGYVINQAMNRIIKIAIILFVAFILAVFGFFYFSDVAEDMYKKAHKTETDAKMKELYEAGDYKELHDYMSERDLFDPDDHQIYVYGQAALLANQYEEFDEKRMKLYDMTDEEIAKDQYYLEYALIDGSRVLNNQIGIYSVLDDGNKAQYMDYCEEIKSYFKFELNVSDEEIEYMTSDKYFSYSKCEEVEKSIRERGLNLR